MVFAGLGRVYVYLGRARVLHALCRRSLEDIYFYSREGERQERLRSSSMTTSEAEKIDLIVFPDWKQYILLLGICSAPTYQ